jgi:cytochrome b561
MPGAEPGYHPVAKTLHWTVALLVLGMLAVGLWMTGLPLGLLKLQVYAWHKWIGLIVLLLTVLRLLWRWRSPPPPLPSTVARWELGLAPLVHWTLLALLVAMPVSGWLMSSAAGVAVVWFGVLPLPDLVPRDQQLFAALRTTHYILSRALMVMIVLHVAAVLRHDVLRRDGIFRRMSPFSRSR